MPKNRRLLRTLIMLKSPNLEAVASRWWDKEGEFKPLHRINPLRLNYIAGHADGLFGKNVLDVGCGGGILAESMAREGANVTGTGYGV